MFTQLTGGCRVNIGLLKEAASKELFTILEKCEGTKAIVWDDSLSGPVGLVTKYTMLKERNVITMIPLRAGPLPDIDVKHIIFITRPHLKLMDSISDNVLNEDKKRRKINPKEFHLFFLPKLSMLCEQHLKMKGVYGSFTNIGEFKCELFPVDNDLLSMELKDSYRELFIDGDPTCLHLSASALVTLQKFYGRIPKIYGKGASAQKVWELAKMMGKEDGLPAIVNGEKGAIDQLVLIDRSIDLMSVLTTQLTYEGLIDEQFGIKQSTAHFPPERFTKSDDTLQGMSSAEKKSVILNSNDEIFNELRDKNFMAVGQILSRHAKKVSLELEERHGDKSVQDMKKFVERLPQILANKQLLALHTTIAEMIKDYTDSNEFLDELDCEQEFLVCADTDKASAFIEDLLAKHAPLKTVLRLICMQSIAGTGLKQKILDYYKRELCQVYGIQCLLTIGNLERAGLIKIQTGTRTYAVLRKTLNLTVENVAEIAPTDISYVHTFYAPLSIRIIENILKPLGWQALSDVISCIPGPTFEDYQVNNNSNINDGGGGAGHFRRVSITSELSEQSDNHRRVILVFFIGGCTFAEISALRFLSQQDNVEFIIATTKLINKNSFLDSFIENI